MKFWKTKAFPVMLWRKPTRNPFTVWQSRKINLQALIYIDLLYLKNMTKFQWYLKLNLFFHWMKKRRKLIINNVLKKLYESIWNFQKLKLLPPSILNLEKTTDITKQLWKKRNVIKILAATFGRLNKRGTKVNLQ